MTDYMLPTIAFDAMPGEHLAAAARSAVAESGIIRISAFPGDPQRFIAFLTEIGTPLRYYGDETGTHPADPAIWRIKYDVDEASRGDTHALAGPLPPHSSQSLRVPRPPYFSMLMVDSGWQDGRPGSNGESLFVRWADVFAHLAFELGAAYETALSQLLADVPFPGDLDARSVAYRLCHPVDEFDIGVRLKNGLLEKLRVAMPGHPAVQAVKMLCATASATAHRVQLASGDLVLLDNDRWGHGRETVIGDRMRAGKAVVNPRELWSVTVG